MFSKFIARLNKGSVLVPAVLLAVFVVFKVKFEQIFDAIAVKPLLAFVQSDWPTDAVFVLATLTAIIFFVKNLRESVWVAPAKLGYWLVILLILLWYRAVQAPWIFVPFRTIEPVTYADFVLLSIMLVVAMMLRTICRKKQKNEPKGLIEGLPLGKGDVEKLGYSLYAKRLADRINESVFKNSFAIGITGEWGVGKTSFVNLVKRELNKSKTIVIDFNAWDSSSPKDITNDFFAVVSAKVSKHHTELSHLLISYAHQLTKTDIPIWSYYVKKLVGEEGFKSPAWYRDKISNILRRIKKRLVVCIDELDRLDKEELVEVIRLIRNTANLPNVVFLVTYDRNYVVNALKGTDRLRSEYFLEKIFQIEITLPRYSENFIKADLKEKLTKVVNDPIYTSQIEAVLEKKFPDQFSVFRYVKTLRDVNKLVNAIFLDLDPLIREIVFEDFLLLEILRIRYPAVYELLYKRKDEFLTVAPGLAINDRYVFVTSGQGEFAIIEYIKRHKEQLSIAENEIGEIKPLLATIFRNSHGYRENEMLSVCKPRKFGRYFSFRLFENELSEGEFQDALGGTNEEFTEYTKLAIQKGQQYELVDRLHRESKFDSSRHYERVIDAIFLIAEHSAATFDYSFGMESKLSDKSGRITKLYGKDANAAGDYVKQKFLTSKGPLLILAQLTAEARNLMIDEDYILTHESLDEILLQYLKRHLESISQLDRDAWQIYWCCKVKAWHTDSNGNLFATEKVIPGASDVFIEFIKTKDFKGFLRAILYRPHEKGETPTKARIDEQPITLLFGGWQSFRSFLYQQRTEEKEYVREFIALFEQLEAKSFSEAVEFEFKKLFDPIEDQ